MTFNAIETSAQDGMPVELYLFQRGNSVWTYTSAQDDIEYLGNVYTPAEIERGEITRGNELGRQELPVRVLGDSDIAVQFLFSPPGEVLTLNIFRQHLTDADSEFLPVWIGRVISSKWTEHRSIAELSCEPFITSMRRNGLIRPYSYQCPHTLYEIGFGACNVIAENFRAQGVVLSKSGITLEIPAADAYADSYFDGGFVYWQRPDGLRDSRMIVSHTGAQIIIAAQMPYLEINDSVELYPGCDRSTDDCENVFDNLLNHGGFALPQINPFGGVQVF